MASQALEQILEFAPRVEQEKIYKTIDLYTRGTTTLYTPPPKPFNPIGSMGSGFQTGAKGNIRRDLGYGLQERYDFSEHNGTVHINYDLLGASKKFSKKALGDAHEIDLSYLFKDKE